MPRKIDLNYKSGEMMQASRRLNKILVVDDDARIRDLLRRYLTQEGFEVLLAEDGKSLGRIMLRETADLIVLDLMMPGEDGLSICRRLRAANDLTPIIILTAKSEDVDRIVGLEVGADDYLGKPFNPRELLARIHAVLRRRPGPFGWHRYHLLLLRVQKLGVTTVATCTYTLLYTGTVPNNLVSRAPLLFYCGHNENCRI